MKQYESSFPSVRTAQGSFRRFQSNPLQFIPFPGITATDGNVQRTVCWTNWTEYQTAATDGWRCLVVRGRSGHNSYSGWEGQHLVSCQPKLIGATQRKSVSRRHGETNYGITELRQRQSQQYCAGTANTEGDLQQELRVHMLHAVQLAENTTLKFLLAKQNVRNVNDVSTLQ